MSLFYIVIISAGIFAVCVLIYLLRTISDIPSGQSVKKISASPYIPSDLDNKPKTGKEYSGEGKNDERALEVGDVETTFVSVEDDSQKFYQNLGNKLKQDAATEMLIKAAQKNDERQAIQRAHQQAHREAQRQVQKKQDERKQNNKKQIEKLRGTKVKKEVEKKVEKKNIELTDKDIKKIKLKANSGKIK